MGNDLATIAAVDPEITAREIQLRFPQITVQTIVRSGISWPRCNTYMADVQYKNLPRPLDRAGKNYSAACKTSRSRWPTMASSPG